MNQCLSLLGKGLINLAINCSHFRHNVLERMRESAECEGWGETRPHVSYNAACLTLQKAEQSRLGARYEINITHQESFTEHIKLMAAPRPLHMLFPLLGKVCATSSHSWLQCPLIASQASSSKPPRPQGIQVYDNITPPATANMGKIHL